jgi:hypothetical protein
MSANSYHFVTRWRVAGSPEEVYTLIDNAPDLARWWPAVYLDVKEIEPGDAQGLGKVVRLHTKGWLPYTLRWQFRTVEKEFPRRLALEAWGDFVGRGLWTFTPAGDGVDVTFDWDIRADKPLLRLFSFVLGPIFAANHRWAMARGEESLKLELARRHAPDEAARARVPPPPGPTTTSSVPLMLGVLGGLLVLGAAVYGLVRLFAG